jgi:hypothetical protein
LGPTIEVSFAQKWHTTAYWLVFRSHTRLPITKLDMTLSQQVGVFPIDLLIGDEKITTRISGAHADIVSKVDCKVP